MGKREILVLDAFTNGHEAARYFMGHMGWNEKDCEIVFCGTHGKLLQTLSSRASYAVVPIHNSIAREVTEVTTPLGQLREMGYELIERARTDLRIHHCLLAPEHIDDPRKLTGVITHEKAFEQCRKYLTSIGIKQEHFERATSTGNAAKVVSRLENKAAIGAIAPEAAAREYGLRILASNIQDTNDNRTTFVLLENPRRIDPVTVGIIGINGRFGKLLEKFYRSLGCAIIGSDIGTEMANENVMREADVIIFAVPLKTTPDIIQSVIGLAKEDQLLMDVTSLKTPAMEAMLRGKAQVVGLHPMFRPDMPFDGQTVVACAGRLEVPRWKTWVVNVLAATKARIKWSSATEHDQFMLAVQVLPHSGNLTGALLLAENETPVDESLAFVSPFYRLTFSLMGRLVGQNPDLYASILMDNPGTVAVLETRIAIERRLIDAIRNGNQEELLALFARARAHFGDAAIAEADTLFARLLSVLNTLYGANSIMIDFPASQSRPGLLRSVMSAFEDHGVNLTGINSVIVNGRLQFSISLELPKGSDQVRQALEKIEGLGGMVVSDPV